MNTEQQRQIMTRLKSEGKTLTQALGTINAIRNGRDSVENYIGNSASMGMVKQAEVERSNPGFLADLKDMATGIGDVIKKGSQKQMATVDADLAGEQSGASTALQHGLNAVGTVGSVVGDTVFGTAKAIAPQRLEDWTGEMFGKVAEGVANNETVQKIAQMSQEEMEQLRVNNPEGYRNVQAILSGVGGATELTVGKGASALTGATKTKLAGIAEQAPDYFKSIDDVIKSGTESVKSLKMPSINGGFNINTFVPKTPEGKTLKVEIEGLTEAIEKIKIDNSITVDNNVAPSTDIKKQIDDIQAQINTKTRDLMTIDDSLQKSRHVCQCCFSRG